MIQKLKNFKRKVIKTVTQAYADQLVKRMQIEVDIEDQTQFWLLFEQAAKLNAYCIVFHDIYLD
jgi:hypothetical protein